MVEAADVNAAITPSCLDVAYFGSGMQGYMSRHFRMINIGDHVRVSKPFEVTIFDIVTRSERRSMQNIKSDQVMS